MIDPVALRKYGVLIAANTGIGGEVVVEPPVQFFPRTMVRDSRIGAFTYVTQDVELNYCTIGRYCSIGREVLANPSTHPVEWLTTSPLPYTDVFGTGHLKGIPFALQAVHAKSPSATMYGSARALGSWAASRSAMAQSSPMALW